MTSPSPTQEAKRTCGAPDEPVLPDDYPIYAGYLYVADGVPVVSDFHNITAAQFRLLVGAKELRRCDIVWRREVARIAREHQPQEPDHAAALIQGETK